MKKADNFYTYRPLTMQQSAQTIYLKKQILPTKTKAFFCQL